MTKFHVLVLQSSDYFSVIAMKARVDNHEARLTDFRGGAGKEIISVSDIYSSAERKLDVYLKLTSVIQVFKNVPKLLQVQWSVAC